MLTIFRFHECVFQHFVFLLFLIMQKPLEKSFHIIKVTVKSFLHIKLQITFMYSIIMCLMTIYTLLYSISPRYKISRQHIECQIQSTHLFAVLSLPLLLNIFLVNCMRAWASGPRIFKK